MKIAMGVSLAVLLLSGVAAAHAEHHEANEVPEEPKAEVVETNEAGKATKVRIGEQVYDVCTERGQDSCINPRDAGLDFGRRELDYWPGKPASQIDEPLPAEKPVELPAEESAEPQEG